MDTLQKQLNALSVKVDGLHQLIEQLSLRVTEVVTECKVSMDHSHQSEKGIAVGYRHRTSFNTDFNMEHKDILIDGDSFDASNPNNERQLSPEIQIQRLTAQLTAAYSRIAALEEQLIAKRIH